MRNGGSKVLAARGCSPLAAWARDGVGAGQQAAVSPVLAVPPLCQTSWRTQAESKLDLGGFGPFLARGVAKLLISGWAAEGAVL